MMKRNGIPKNWDELIEAMKFVGDCEWNVVRWVKDQERYEDYKKSISREEFVESINEKIGGKIAILKNDFPYTRTLSKLPKVKQYILWSKKGSLNENKIKKIATNRFANKKWCWMESDVWRKSVPEIWHCHIFVDES